MGGSIHGLVSFFDGSLNHILSTIEIDRCPKTNSFADYLEVEACECLQPLLLKRLELLKVEATLICRALNLLKIETAQATKDSDSQSY